MARRRAVWCLRSCIDVHGVVIHGLQPARGELDCHHNCNTQNITPHLHRHATLNPPALPHVILWLNLCYRPNSTSMHLSFKQNVERAVSLPFIDGEVLMGEGSHGGAKMSSYVIFRRARSKRIKHVFYRDLKFIILVFLQHWVRERCTLCYIKV